MLLVTLGGIFIVSALIGVLTTGLDARIAELRKGRSRGHRNRARGDPRLVRPGLHRRRRAGRGEPGRQAVDAWSCWPTGTRSRWRTRSGPGSATPAGPGSSAAPAARSSGPTWSWSASTRPARSSCCRRPATTPTSTSSRCCCCCSYRDVGRPTRPHVVAAVQRHRRTSPRPGWPAARTPRSSTPTTSRSGWSCSRTASPACPPSAPTCSTSPATRSTCGPSRRWSGGTYGDALRAYRPGLPDRPAATPTARSSLNPPMDTVIGAGDEIIVIAEDDLLIRLAAAPGRGRRRAIVAATEPAAAARPDAADRLERPRPDGSSTCSTSWSSRAPPWTSPAPPSREPAPGGPANSARRLQGLRPDQPPVAGGAWTWAATSTSSCSPTTPSTPTTPTTGRWSRCCTCATSRSGLGDPYSIVTEMNDDANREVAQVTKADDFIVSNKLISLLLTQLAENRHLQGVFAELFDPSGVGDLPQTRRATTCDPARRPTSPPSIEAARRRGETAIGYRTRSHGEQAPGYGVVLNPAEVGPADPVAPTTASSSSRRTDRRQGTLTNWNGSTTHCDGSMSLVEDSPRIWHRQLHVHVHATNLLCTVDSPLAWSESSSADPARLY